MFRSIWVTILLLIIASPVLSSPVSNVIGKIVYYKASKEENLYDIARKFDVGIDELLYANIKVDPWLLSEGQEIIIPSMHILPSIIKKGIIINRAELRLYYYPEENNINNVNTFPISLGVSGHETPIGITKIISKKTSPFWFPPTSIIKEKPGLPKVVPPGQDNPLGEYAIYSGWPKIIIHGTNKPWGIGTYGSHGCIRMYPKDIKKLYNKSYNGMTVQVIDEPLKIGFTNNKVYLQIMLTENQKLQIDFFGYIIFEDEINSLKTQLQKIYLKHNLPFNDKIIGKLLKENKGLPILISE